MNIILMGSFMFCPQTATTVVANECQECEFIGRNDEDYFCSYEETGGESELSIKALIILLLELMESGQTRIDMEELARLFPDQE